MSIMGLGLELRTMGKEPDENLKIAVHDLVDDRINAEFGKAKERARYFLYGLGALIVIVTALGLFTELQIMRYLHDNAFPPVRDGQVGIAYESVIHLQNQNPLQQVGTVRFYAKANQEVKYYLKFVHQLTGALGRRNVIVMIDNTEIDEGPMDETALGFHEITKYLKYSSMELGNNVHSISFSLDDTQSAELTDTITIHCIILVYEVGG